MPSKGLNLFDELSFDVFRPAPPSPIGAERETDISDVLDDDLAQVRARVSASMTEEEGL